MSNYVESKKTLDKIRSEYGCKGEMIFRTALQCVVQYGTDNLTDDWSYIHALEDINNRHDAAEAGSEILFMSRDFEIAILECAREIAKVNIYDLLVYVQKEVWLSHEGGIDYQRAIELLKSSLEYLEGYNNCNNKENYEAFVDIGLDDDEIEAFGWGYLLNETEEDN